MVFYLFYILQFVPGLQVFKCPYTYMIYPINFWLTIMNAVSNENRSTWDQGCLALATINVECLERAQRSRRIFDKRRRSRENLLLWSRRKYNVEWCIWILEAEASFHYLIFIYFFLFGYFILLFGPFGKSRNSFGRVEILKEC
jgi:hypothetical protein